MKGACIAAALTLCALPATAADLDLAVKATGRGFVFVARSGGPYEQCNVVLNDGYKASLDRIDSTGSTDLWFTEFTKGSLRFDPMAERVRRVHVLCSRPAAADALFKP